MSDAHDAAVASALQANRALKRLQARMGTTEAPNGAVLTAYRVARAALRTELRRGDLRAARAVLIDLQERIQAEAATLVRAAERVGAAHARQTLEAYDLARGDTLDIAGVIDGAEAQTVAAVQAQLIGAQSLLAVGRGDEAMLLGDGGARLGVVQPAPIQSTLARALTVVSATAFAAMVFSALQTSRTVPVTAAPNQPAVQGDYSTLFGRQAVAAIDERTTDCCLRVHGQVVTMGAKFKLTGTPRFADELDAPPFHWWCRTAEALVLLREAEDATTARMRAAAQSQLQAVAAGNARAPRYVNAFS